MPSSPVPAIFPEGGFFGAMVNSSRDAIISKDLEGIVTSWNPGAETLFGYTADEMIGQSVTVLMPPDRIPEEAAILDRIRRGEQVEHYETVRRRKDGGLLGISLTVSPIYDAQGNIVGASKIARDITRQWREQERFRVTLSSIGDAVISTDVAGRVVFMNSVAEELTAWADHEAAGRPVEEIFNLVSEIDRQPVESPVAKALREGRVVGLANHTILIARDDRERWIDDSAAPIRDSSGAMVGAVLIFRDVTARREADLAATRLAAIVEGSDDAIVGKNLDGIVTNWNPAAERIFGYTAAEMIGQPITRVIPPDRLGEEQHILARIQRGERVDHFVTVRRRKDGCPIHVSLTISPIFDREGRIVGASKIARDITDIIVAQKRLKTHAAELEAKVQERTVELRESVAELETFSYSLSHDMRAPLRTIQSYSEIVLEDFDAELPAEAAGHLKRVVAAANRMDRLIRDVLTLARTARSEFVVEPVDVEEVVRDVLQERSDIDVPDASIEVVRPLDPVMAQPALLFQCIANYLDNAVKFVAPGVRPMVRIHSETTGDRVRLCVTDNGIGIDPEEQKKLFEIFKRLDSAKGYFGTGLGLAIVRRATKRMGGSPGVRSTPGLGSTFWIELLRA